MGQNRTKLLHNVISGRASSVLHVSKKAKSPGHLILVSEAFIIFAKMPRMCGVFNSYYYNLGKDLFNAALC